jgi:hypothetical protein
MRVTFLMFITFLCSQTAFAESVPFEVCTESSTWTRPSPELQANKIWKDTRYKGFGKDAYAWSHDFLVIDEQMNVSGILAVTNLSGLWTVKTQWLHKCYLDRQRDVSSWVEVVLLLHRVKEIQYDAKTYTVVVERSGKGFQWFFIRRINGPGVVRFVTPEGKQLDVWDERALPARLTKTNAQTTRK